MYTLYVGVSPTPLRYRDFAHCMARCFTHAEARRLWMDTSFHPRHYRHFTHANTPQSQ